MKKIIIPILLGTSMSMMTVVNAAESNSDSSHHGSGHHMTGNNSTGHHGDTMTNSNSEMPAHHNSTGHHKKQGHHQSMMKGGHAMSSKAGMPGKEVDVTRTINVIADDSMRFTHEAFDIKAGETIKFVVTNQGAINHEFSIATKNEHMAHGKMMMDNPDMHHGPGGGVITIKPGETENLIWKFMASEQVEAACNIPGHYEAGMHSAVNVLSK
jgi:uncharacterized cupredoxin-like copper-binding protein